MAGRSTRVFRFDLTPIPDAFQAVTLSFTFLVDVSLKEWRMFLAFRTPDTDKKMITFDDNSIPSDRLRRRSGPAKITKKKRLSSIK
jgi:hypothetical protein